MPTNCQTRVKDRCLKLLDEVASRRTPVIVTKRGRPVARLMPLPLRAGARAAMVAGRGASGARETGPGYAAAGAESKSAPGSGARERLAERAAVLGMEPDALLHFLLDSESDTEEDRRAVEDALSVAGMIRTGPSDYAVNHAHYFAEALWEDYWESAGYQDPPPPLPPPDADDEEMPTRPAGPAPTRGRVFVDTSAVIALLVEDQALHEDALATWERLVAAARVGGGSLVTHHAVVIESLALLQKHHGMPSVRQFLDRVLPRLRIVWISAELHERGVAALLAADRRRVSIVDWISFEVMRSEGIRRAFAYDADFWRQQFFPA